jgi:hypothetical protein
MVGAPGWPEITPPQHPWQPQQTGIATTTPPLQKEPEQ